MSVAGAPLEARSPDALAVSRRGVVPGREGAPAAPFFSLLEPVTVERLGNPPFAGAVLRAHAEATWLWVRRDLAPDLAGGELSPDMAVPDLVARMRDAHALIGDYDHERRLRGQLGGEDALLRLPLLIAALKNHALLARARDFGHALEALEDEGDIAQALRAIPLQDSGIAAPMLMAAVGEVSHPARLVTAAIRLAGGGTEAALVRAGFAPLFDAMLAHAQNQTAALERVGVFADADLACRAVDRFHRLLRAVTGYLDTARSGRWGGPVAHLTTGISQLLEPRLRDLPPLVSQALRMRADGADRLDRDALLAALGGMYLLATVKECRTSLAVNAVFDQVWLQVGQMLELLLTRSLDLLRANPTDANTAARLEAGIKMAELRFNSDYADVLRRARDSAARKVATA